MTNMIKNVLIFGAGALTGSVCSIQILKGRLKEDAELEIAEMRAYYREKMKENKAEETITKEEEEFKPIEEVIEEDSKVDKAEKIIEDRGYVNYANYMAHSAEDIDEEDNGVWDIPYVIDAEEYGDKEDYDTEVLTYFTDKVLVDEVDEIIEDMDTVVGLDNLSIFEEFEGARVVYVRNEIYKTDFMICKDDWKYSDLSDYPKSEKKPHQL